MLFSEPKIPHHYPKRTVVLVELRFSALQRAENSSPNPPRYAVPSRRSVSVLFSEPKIPHSPPVRYEIVNDLEFQCSSASRKFLTRGALGDPRREGRRFSALQRAENSSRHRVSLVRQSAAVSVLFSEPKIPHAERRRRGRGLVTRFSALQRAENSSHKAELTYTHN